MAQHNNEHLTIVQLSAYLDKELAPTELALFDAHLQNCQSCQQALTDLRLASALLHAMPQVQPSRSFTLSPDIALVPESVLHREQPVSLHAVRQQRIWQRSIRALSSVAAILGLLFILAGVITSVTSNGTATSSGVAVNAGSAPSSSATGGNVPPHVATQPQSTHPASQSSQGTSTTPTSIQPAPQSTPPGASFVPPSILDLGKSEGRLSIGSLIFVLGILGLVATRRSSQRTL